MRPVSAAFLRTVTGSHQMLARATVCEMFQTGVTPVGTRIPVLGGDVQIDGTADIRSTLDLATDGTAMWPTRADSLLAPYGNEVYVERGIAYSDIDVEWVGLGYFRIQAPEQNDAPDEPIRISGRDRMAGIIDARLLAPRQFVTGASLAFIMNTLVLQVYPAATIEWDDATSSVVLARSVLVEEDRFAFLDELVRSQGKVWYWDHRGVLVIRSVPNPAKPVVELSAGRGGVLLNLSRQISREGVYNAVVASGEATDTAAPVRAVAIDNNSDSPTYFFGRFGPVPRFFTSSFIATTVQAQVAANAMLTKNLGLPYNVDLSAVPNPALEPFDPVEIRHGDRDGPELHVLETLTVPLVQDATLTATTREQTVVLIGDA